MLLLLLYTGFYVAALALSQALTLPRQAFVTGIACTIAACVAGLTLWALTRTTLIEPWLAIAMGGAIALPTLMMGLGFLAGWWLRYRHKAYSAWAVAAVVPVAAAWLAFSA